MKPPPHDLEVGLVLFLLVNTTPFRVARPLARPLRTLVLLDCHHERSSSPEPPAAVDCRITGVDGTADHLG